MNHKEFSLFTDMRKLWSDHIIYTRQFIISYIANLPDLMVVKQRLLFNQEEIGNLFKQYYDDTSSRIITDFLKEHIIIFSDFISVIRNPELSTSRKVYWYMNAIKIAEFLSHINPKYNKIVLRDMLFDHLDFTEREALARIRNDYTLDIIMFDSVFEEIIMMADTLSEGIIRDKKDMFKVIDQHDQHDQQEVEETEEIK